MRKVLVLHYSQSDQLTEILDRVCGTLAGDELELHHYRIRPDPEFPFPWSPKEFFDTFPETHLQESCALDLGDETLLHQRYDLIILGYQVWFLTPSIPVNSFLMHPVAKELFRDTPVVTLVACRNMWLMAQEKLKARLAAVKAVHVGHIALVDRHINHISVITIAHWMFSGNKSRYLGIFPKPGVAENDIQDAARFGALIRRALLGSTLQNLQSELLSVGAVRISSVLMVIDKRGNAIFSKWAPFLKARGPKGSRSRSAWIPIFRCYLNTAIWVLSPLAMVVFALLWPFTAGRLKRDKAYYSTVRPIAPHE